jgi:mRNA-degrading endonuclease toxin of MazEF toxin-antitoxin module
MSDALQTGRIVWVEIEDANGIRKLRPGVIVTPTDRITAVGPIEVVAVTSRLSDPLPDDYVLLPWHPKGHARTKLTRKSAAVCTWIARINTQDVRDVGGVVPGQVLLEILTKIAAALN